MTSRTLFYKLMLLVILIFSFVAFLGCGGGKAIKSDAEEQAVLVPAVTKDVPLGKKYGKVVFKKFEAALQIESDYPGMVAECENTAIAATTAKKTFNSVEKETPGAKYADALLVMTKVVNIRIVSGAARFIFGPGAGQSRMSLQIKLVDAASGDVVREKKLTEINTPWTLGGSDRSIPSDIGKMIAEYLSDIQPK